MRGAGAAAVDLGSAPLNYLTSAGAKAAAVLPLTWALLLASVAAITVFSWLVLAGVLRRRPAPAGETPGPPGPIDRPRALRWVYYGVGICAVPLVIATIWTFAVMARISEPAVGPSVSVAVTARQWWWEARYLSDAPAQVFSTANEIHIPVGEPVRIELRAADVIHSFWVPALAGKMDLIPGRTNTTWLEADRAGVFLGQCTEFCGVGHARMQLRVVAEPREDFEAWRLRQLARAPEPASDVIAAGRDVLVQRCGSCHAVRGTPAGGRVAPDLTHLMSRGTIGAGTLPNSAGALLGWIEDPHSSKPGARMPAMYLSGEDLTRLHAFLETLE